jgi:hypothetical protein
MEELLKKQKLKREFLKLGKSLVGRVYRNKKKCSKCKTNNEFTSRILRTGKRNISVRTICTCGYAATESIITQEFMILYLNNKIDWIV